MLYSSLKKRYYEMTHDLNCKGPKNFTKSNALASGLNHLVCLQQISESLMSQIKIVLEQRRKNKQLRMSLYLISFPVLREGLRLKQKNQSFSNKFLFEKLHLRNERQKRG